MKRYSWFWIVFGLVGGLLFGWTVLMKLISRLAARFNLSGPCPFALAWLVDNPVRQRYMRPVLDWIGIQPGETVLELGPGPGVFTVEAARRVGNEGRVVAVDIQPEMIYRVGQRVRAAGLTNVTIRVADAQELPLPDASVDRAFLISVLDEIPDPARALAELRRVLKPDGVLSLTAEFLDPDYRFLGETIRLLESAGFALVSRSGNVWRYTANFRKVEGDATGRSYYVARQERLLREFDGVVRQVRPLLAARYAAPFVETVAAEARQEYARLIPQLPYIGGRGNKLTWNLVGTAWFVVFYRVMRAHGRPMEEIGRLLTDMYKVWLDAYPGWLLRLQGWFAFTSLAQWQLERRAQHSQERRYPDDWVLTRVPPNGYDFGVDYTECGIVKFCQAQGAAELLPYLCPLDFIMSERMKLGLVRTTTLAEGGKRCNFRFKQGGETQWPVAGPKEVKQVNL